MPFIQKTIEFAYQIMEPFIIEMVLFFLTGIFMRGGKCPFSLQ